MSARAYKGNSPAAADGRSMYYGPRQRGCMRAVANLVHWRLADRVEESLKKLNFSYIKNGGHTVTEFVVDSPCHFMVTIEDRTRQQVGLLFRSRLKVESLVELRPTIGAGETTAELVHCATPLVRELEPELPQERWEAMWVFE